MSSARVALLHLAAGVAAGVTAGVYTNFSARIMPRLARVPAPSGIATMQQFNRVALQAPFMSAFFGGALASAAAVGAAVLAKERTWLHWAGALGAACYLCGWALTIVYNVPRNGQLDAAQATDPAATAGWERYLREWTPANTVRAVFSWAGAALLLTAGGVGLGRWLGLSR